MKQKMARQFCQMESLKTTYHNAVHPNVLFMTIGILIEAYKQPFSQV